MITGKLKNDIDKLWEEFWTGGITNPLTVIEQISFLMFARLLDVTRDRNEKRAERTKKPFKGDLRSEGTEPPLVALPTPQGRADARDCAGQGVPALPDSERRDDVQQYIADAQLMIQRPSLLVSAVNRIEDLPITPMETPRGIFTSICSVSSRLLESTASSERRATSSDLWWRWLTESRRKPWATPRCGTAGFLVGVMLYLAREVQLIEEASNLAEGGERGLHGRQAQQYPTASTSRARCSTGSTSTAPCCGSRR